MAVKLPGIKFGADRIQGAFGRHDTGIPARSFAAKSEEIQALTEGIRKMEEPVIRAVIEQKNRKELMQLDDADFEMNKRKAEFDRSFSEDEIDASKLNPADVPGLDLTRTIGGQTVSRGKIPRSEFLPQLRFKKINQLIKEQGQSIKNPRLRKEFEDKHFAKNENDFANMTISAAKTQKDQRKKRQIQQLRDLELREDFDGQREIISNMEIPAEEKATLNTSVSQNQEISGVKGLLLNGNDFQKAQTEKALRNKDYPGQLTTQQRISLANELKNNRKTSTTKEDNKQLNNIKARINEHNFGSENGLDPKEADRIADPDKRKTAKDAIRAQIDGREVKDLLFASDFETAEKRLRKLEAKALEPGSPERDLQAYNTAVTAAAEFERQWAEDPVATIFSHDKAVQEMMDNLPEDPQDRVQAATAIRGYLRATQERRGVVNPSLLSEAQAEALGAQIGSFRGQDYAINMAQMKAEFGNDWVDVQRQLRDGNYISGVEAVMGDLPASSLAVADLSVASNTREEIWTTLNLPKGGGTEFNQLIQESLGPIGQTIRLSSEGDSTVYSDYQESVALLAGLWLSQGRVATAEQAIKKAVNELLLDQYHEIDSTYRVPKSYPETIKNRVNTLLAEPRLIGFDPLPQYAGMDNAEELTLEAFKSSGYFVNNGNDTGLVPVLDGGIPLMKDDEIMEISFDTLNIPIQRLETPIEKRRRRR